MTTTKQLKFLLLAVLLIITGMASAQTYTVDGLCYEIVETEGVKSAKVEQHPGYLSGSINIPSTVNIEGVDYMVTSIADYAFNEDKITSVTMPNTIVKIGSSAFSGCNNLTSISIPSSVTTIGSDAFGGTGISSLIIPKSVTSIDEYIASECANLTTIKVESGNSVYDSRNNCNAIILTAEDELIQGCNNTRIPDDVDCIGSSAFAGCTGLTSVNLSGISSIGSWAFQGCTGLTNVDLCHVFFINRYAFSGCENLRDISLENVSSLYEKAFYNCKSLTSIYIPAKLTTIEGGVFAGCSGLTSITVDPSNKYFDSRNNCNAIIYTKKNRLIAGCVNTVFPSDVTEIDNYAFEGCTGLTDIVIPENITEIGAAFAFCTNLQHIDIPASVTYIDGGAFEGCSSLRTFTFPSGISKLYNLFTDCTNLEEVYIPSQITYVGSQVFRGCTNLRTVVVDPGNTVFDSRNNCNAIIETATNKLVAGCSTTVIPEDVTEIGDYAFYGSGLISVVVPNSVTKIGKRAFYKCESLTSVSLPSSITEIPYGCFSNCSSLKEITIPEGVTFIDDNSFGSCTSLKKVFLPSTLNKFGRNVFSHTESLETVIAGMTTPPAIDETFPSRATATLYVPAGSVPAYQAADYWKEFGTILEQAAYIAGDANGDSSITVADYIAIAHYIMGNPPANFNEKAADANGDGQINVADYIAVAHIIMNSNGK